MITLMKVIPIVSRDSLSPLNELVSSGTARPLSRNDQADEGSRNQTVDAA